MSKLLPAQPHGPIEEIFPDVFRVAGSLRLLPGLSMTRNMTVVRQGDELTVINTVRLDERGEEELARLGKVAHVVRIGFFHGADDAYYVDRYKATLWAPRGIQHAAGLTARDLTRENCPVADADVFIFEKGKFAEAIVLLPANDGVLIPCDSYQNWTTFEGCSFLCGAMLRAMGFGPTLIGGPWTKRMGQGVRGDFQRLRELPFSHLVPAHGTVLRDDARQGLDKAIAHRFRGP